MSSFPRFFNVAVTAAESLAGEEYRPQTWDKPAQTMLTVPATSQPGSSPLTATGSVAGANGAIEPALDNFPGAPTVATKEPLVYVFDAILRADHDRRMRITQHPVQTGANISDHAYRLQPRITLEIGMSDAMQSYDPDSWSSDSSKSVSAFQTVVDMMENCTLMTLTTRLSTYPNVLIESIQAPDTYKTKYGLRMTVTFRQIGLGVVEQTSSRVVTTVPVSARPQTSFATAVGQLQTANPSQAIVSQHNILSAVQGEIPAAVTLAKVPGATLWSSLNISTLKSLVK